MIDQAEKLRRMVSDLGGAEGADDAAADPSAGGGDASGLPKAARRAGTKLITVTSGKGGVGKTNFTVNLAIALGRMGYKVTIIDADFGLANVDVLMGMTVKSSILETVSAGRDLMEALCEGPEGVMFLSGGSGVEEIAKLDPAKVGAFIEGMVRLDGISDVIIVDTGAGLSDTVMDFILASDETVFVVTPEPTAITDAYALMKMVVGRDRAHKLKILINRAESEEEARSVTERLTFVAGKFLSYAIESVGYIPYDENVVRAVKRQQPFTMAYPRSEASQKVAEIARTIMELGAVNAERKGVRGFLRGLFGSAKA
ncbi:MAG: MinD/ParA family protein [Oscillospiraceae bacterium]|nr:MinD/ParA family protein [Oscillospiraceae bacterium]